ncbi:MAG TPA: hypothetical protein VMT38_05545 [Terracidiphilus sp.]|nr:hypothetical protein [Terracidiphilus sp.]
MASRLHAPSLALLLCAASILSAPPLIGAQPGTHLPIVESDSIKIGGTGGVGASTLEVDFADGPLDLGRQAIVARIATAASAVATYYGRFPLASARILIIPVAGRHGILQGTTWGDMHGSPGFTRLRIGEHTTAAELSRDWMITHELTHMAFPDMPSNPDNRWGDSPQHWIEEGLATYVEPIARVMVGDMTANEMWTETVRDMPQGEPQPGDEGLDHTHTWGRTYWGGAMFCQVADVEIREQTQNRFGLQDALRAIVAAGGTIDHDWTLPQALAIGDRATGTHVLTDLYAQWKDKPVQYDLPALWDRLGIHATSNGVEFSNSAPLAAVREAITKPEGNPIRAIVAPTQPPIPAG